MQRRARRDKHSVGNTWRADNENPSKTFKAAQQKRNRIQSKRDGLILAWDERTRRTPGNVAAKNTKNLKGATSIPAAWRAASASPVRRTGDASP